MRRAALAALLLAAAPASAQKLKGFEGQFGKGATDAGAKVLGAMFEGMAKVAEAGERAGQQGFTGNVAADILLIPFYPLAAATRNDRRLMPERRLRAHVVHVDDRVRGWGGEFRYGFENHLNAEAHWTAFLEEGSQYDLHYFGARVSGDLVTGDWGDFVYGLGFGALSGTLHRGGPEFSLGTEVRPRRWVFVDARAGATFMEGGTVGDLSAGAGVRWRAVELRAGYRALAGPFRTLGGPQLGVGLRW